MKLQTALENLEFYAYHGMYPEEKINGGLFKVDVWIDEEVSELANFKNIHQLINYEAVFAIIKQEMDMNRDFIEDLAMSILGSITKLLVNREVLITVKITKPNPAGKFGSGNASVTLQN